MPKGGAINLSEFYDFWNDYKEENGLADLKQKNREIAQKTNQGKHKNR